MIKFKNEGIQFAQIELNGTLRLIECISNFDYKKNHESNRSLLSTEMVKIANESKLILDPELDSYYLMTIVVNHLPKIIDNMQFLSTSDLKSDQISSILSQITEIKKEMTSAAKLVSSEDANFHGEQAPHFKEEFIAFNSELENRMNKFYGHNLKNQDFNLSFYTSFWSKLNGYLQEMLKARMNRISIEKNEAIYHTSFVWLISLILSFFLSIQLLRIQRNLDSELKERTTKLISSSKFSALGEMAAGIAHEVNTPLATILLRAEKIEYLINNKDSNRDEKILQSMNSVRSTIHKISKIIQGLKTFSRQSENDPMIKCSVVSLIDDALALCGERIKNQGVDVKTIIKSGTNESLCIDCRPTEIVQVLVNLIGNSFDAVQLLAKPWIHIEVEDLNEKIKISVIDSGNGIPQSIQEKMMNPFFTTKEVGKGTGLGLSISKGIITNHKGSIFVDSHIKNTCLTVLIPKTAHA